MDRVVGIFGTRDDPAPQDYDFDESAAESTGETPPEHVGQDERRMQVRAYNHWAGQLDNRKYPPIEELDPAALEDFGPYSVLLDFSAGVEEPVIRHLGDKLAEECGAQSEMMTLSDVPSRSLLSRITDHYMQILANEAPIGFEAEFVNQRGLTALYRGILLPYSSDDSTIDYIYGVINWKEMADAATADSLLAEIDQSLNGGASANETPEESAPNGAETLDLAQYAEADPVTDLGAGRTERKEPSELPRPSFGTDFSALPGPFDSDEDEDEDSGVEFSWGSGFSGFDEDEPVYAVDYGVNGLEDENEGEDVDGVVNPLDDDSVGLGLSSLVSRGARAAPSTSLPTPFGGSVDPDAPGEEPFDLESDDEAGDSDTPSIAAEFDPDVETDNVEIEAGEADGLYDCLAAAREMALLARSSEDRSRKTLYQAVGRAYDFSIEAEANREDFEELMQENGLVAQDRAPMTPVVKLVFGADYDKTRITEYATVLAYAHRIGVKRGTLAEVLRQAEGGLKAVVQAERQARREAEGKPVEDKRRVREALAKKLREIEPCALDEIAGEGGEFALVMVRRMPDGALAILGEVPEDVPLIERAARKLVA